MDDFSKTLRMYLTKFNESEEYQDKAQEVFKQLSATKDILVENQIKLIERDGKLDEALLKSKNLKQSSRTFERRARKANTIQKRRQFWTYFWLVLISA